jgi:hypothetical protein
MLTHHLLVDFDRKIKMNILKNIYIQVLKLEELSVERNILGEDERVVQMHGNNIVDALQSR